MAQGEVRLKSVPTHPDRFDQAINANVVIVLEGPARWEFAGSIVWSYSAAPTNGRLTITGGGFGLDVDITAGGPGFIPFNYPQHGIDDTNVIITLYDGGAGITGKLNVLGAWVN